MKHKHTLTSYMVLTGSLIGLAVLTAAAELEWIQTEQQDQSITLRWQAEVGAEYIIASANDLSEVTNQTAAAFTNIIVSTDASPASLTTSSVTCAVSAEQLFFQVQRDPSDAPALGLAETAINRAITYLSEAPGWVPSGTIITNSGSWGSYTSIITCIDWSHYAIEATGVKNGHTRSVHVANILFPTFARYAYWTHDNRDTYIIPEQTIGGWFHSDSQIRIICQPGIGPTFLGPISTALDTYDTTFECDGVDRDIIFNSDQGSMSDVDFTQLGNLATDQGLYLRGDTEITFTNDHMLISNPIAGWTNQLVAITNESIVFVGRESNQTVRLDVHGGVLDGRLTLVSEDDILIRDHIRYLGDPSNETPPPGDSLGLISKDDVWISTAAPDNLVVHASILAAGQGPIIGNRGNFGVNSHDSFTLGPRGTLTIFGSVVQDQTRPKGTVNSRTGDLLTGYNPIFQYDPRLETTPPPYYPRLSEQATISGWSYPE